MKYILPALVVVLAANVAFGQVRGAELISPYANQEICLGTTLPIQAKFVNRDSFAQTIVIRVRITNIVTGITVYSSSYTINQAPPGYTVDTTFEAFVTNANILSQLGTFHACADIVALDDIGDIDRTWPFADSMCTRMFGVRRTSMPFNHSGVNYSTTADGPIPDQRYWLSLGATVVDGDKETWDAPPPISQSDALPSAVIRLDHADIRGVLYSGTGSGDTLTSFTFNVKGQTRVILNFDFMRAGRHRYPALFDADTLLGPEHTVFNGSKQIVRKGDSLIVEVKDPLAAPCEKGKWFWIAGIDGGYDFDFQNFWMQFNKDSTATINITGQPPQTIKLAHQYIDTTFSFRLRVKAADHSTGVRRNDDADPWYIDNVGLFIPRLPEIEVMWVRVVTPYTKLPYASTSALPVYLKLKSRSVQVSGQSPVPLIAGIVNSRGDTIYKETLSIFPATGVDTVLRMPDWNAQGETGSKYTVFGKIAQNGYDNYTDDNETSSVFYLNVEHGDSAVQEFALDNAGLTPKAGAGNDMPKLANAPGAGIGFNMVSGSMAIKFVLSHTDTVLGGRLYFAGANQSPDPIRITLLHGDNSSCVPGDTMTSFTSTRGLYNQFSSYRFPTPVVLPAGVYWLSVSQLAVDNFTLGGSLYRGSGSIMVADQISPEIWPVYSSPYGTQWSPTENSGGVNCHYALETPAGSGEWQEWMPAKGYWPTNLHGNGRPQVTWDPQLTSLTSGGAYLPLIRPMVGSVNPPLRMAGSTTGKLSLECYPNPVNRFAGVLFDINAEPGSRINFVIFNALGEQVRTLANGMFDGSTTLRWDGKDMHGNAVPAGVFMCRLIANGESISTKLIILE